MLDQERVFQQQAQLVGQWDTMLQRNGDKIIALNDEVERIKHDQKKCVFTNIELCFVKCESMFCFSQN